MINKKLLSKICSYWPAFLAVIIFLGFGIVHLAKFETTDEHFWKYDRVPAYFAGWKTGLTTGDWSYTRINDKPGVTTAIISGIGLPFTGHPDAHRDRERDQLYLSPEKKKNGDYKPLHTFYHTERTGEINFALRLPVLLFNAFALVLMYWLLLQTFSRRVSGMTVILVASTPALIGMSQIINPDATLWSTATLTIFAFLAYCSTSQRKFIILTGIFFGFALLSKYTANLLFLFLPVLWALYMHFEKRELLSRELLTRYVITFGSMTAIAFLIFLISLPAAIENVRHFLYATIYSPTLKPLVDILITVTGTERLFFTPGGSYKTLPIIIPALVTLCALVLGVPALILTFLKRTPRLTHHLFSVPLFFFIVIVGISLFNAWTDASIFSLEHLKETSRAEGSLSFPQLGAPDTLWYWLQALMIQSQNFLFALHPLVFIGLFGAVLTTWKTLYKKPMHELTQKPWLIWSFAILFFIFIIGGTIAEIFVNVRYSILLLPLAALITALFVDYLLATEKHFPSNHSLSTDDSGITHKTLRVCHSRLRSGIYNIKTTWIPGYARMTEIKIYVAGLFLLLFSLYHAAPHYFTYTNIFLPQKYYVGDAWGLGLYEAAEYLNTLPNAQNTVIWADHNGIRQWFDGRTITTPHVYLDHTPIHYIVVTRRGSVLKKPSARTENLNKEHVTFSQYYAGEIESIWELHLNDRPGNFVKIYKIED